MNHLNEASFTPALKKKTYAPSLKQQGMADVTSLLRDSVCKSHTHGDDERLWRGAAERKLCGNLNTQPSCASMKFGCQWDAVHGTCLEKAESADFLNTLSAKREQHFFARICKNLNAMDCPDPCAIQNNKCTYTPP